MISTIVKNQLHVLFRSRATLIAMIVAPLLLLFIGGLVFDTTNLYRVRVGVWSESPADLSESVIGALETSKFSVQQYDTEDACANSVKRGDQHACLAFPGHFAVGTSNTLRFYVDPSRATLVSAVLDTISARIANESSDVSKQLAQSLVSALQSIRNTVDLRKDTMVTLTTQVNTAGQSVTQLSESVNAPNTTLDFTSVGLTNASNNVAILEAESINLVNDTVDLIDELQDYLTAADAAIVATNLSNTTKQAIRSSITNASDVADDVLAVANTTSTVISAANITATMELLESRLLSIKTNIDQVAATQLTLGANLNTIGNKLDSALLSIVSIQKGFSEIETALNSITVVDADAVVSPIKTTIVPVTRDVTYVNYAFPFLMVIVLLFSGLLVAPILLLTERHSQAAFRTFLAPIKESVFAQATFLSCLIVLGAQALIMLIVAGFFFNYWIGLPVLILTLLLASSLFILIGMIIGALVQRELTAVIVSVLVGLVLLFASDFIVPLDVLPHWLSLIAQLNPVVIAGSLVRNALLFGGTGLSANILDLAGLVVIGVVLAFFALFAYRTGRQLSLQSILSQFNKKKQ